MPPTPTHGHTLSVALVKAVDMDVCIPAGTGAWPIVVAAPDGREASIMTFGVTCLTHLADLACRELGCIVESGMKLGLRSAAGDEVAVHGRLLRASA